MVDEVGGVRVVGHQRDTSACVDGNEFRFKRPSRLRTVPGVSLRRLRCDKVRALGGELAQRLLVDLVAHAVNSRARDSRGPNGDVVSTAVTY